MLSKKIKKFLTAPYLSGVAVMFLLVGVFLTVNLSQQSQEQRSRASGYDQYNYSNSYNTSYNSNYSSYGGSYCYTILGYTFGNCTTPTPTAVPVVPTATPMPTATPVPAQPTMTSAPTPLPIFTIAPTPTTIPGVTTTVPTGLPGVTPQPGDTLVAVSVLLHGLGNGGDNVNASSQGNFSPLHPTRTATVEVYDVSNQLISTTQAPITFDSGSGSFKGVADLGGNFNTGLYSVKIKTDQFLRGLVPGIQTLTDGQTNTLPNVKLVAGDVNGDNQVNIVDYNILIGCYSDLSPAVSCTPTNNLLADINDDGHVNQFDYNLFIRELTNIGGQ